VIRHGIDMTLFFADPLVLQNIDKSSTKGNKESLLLDFLRTTEKDISRFRYIDINGKPIKDIAFKRDESGLRYIVQNISPKYSSDSLEKLLNSKKGAVLISDISPSNTIEFSSVVYNKEILEGVVIMDLDLGVTISRIIDSALFDVYILNQNGDILFPQKESAKLKDITKLAKERELFLSENGHMFYYDYLCMNPFFTQKLILLLKSKDSLSQISYGIVKMLFISLLVLIPINLVLSWVLSKTYAKLTNRLSIQESLLQQERKMAEIGGMMSYLAHQWLFMLNGLSAIVMAFSSKNQRWIEEKSDRKNMLEAIENKIELMAETLESFRNFYALSKSDEKFNLADAICEIENIVAHKVRIAEAKISKELDSSLSLVGKKSLWMQAVLSIIQNSLDIAIDRKVEAPNIKILLRAQKNYILLSIQDSCGGIEKEVLNSLFDPYISKKENKKGTGIGLYFAKIIIKERFGGDIVAYNGEFGAIFEIKCKL